MKAAWMCVKVTPDNPTQAQIQVNGFDVPHLAVAAHEFDILHAYEWQPDKDTEFHGVTWTDADQVVTLDFHDDDFDIGLHGQPMKPFHLAAVAMWCRNQALAPLVQQAVMQALAAMGQVQKEQELVRGILVPGNGGRSS